MFVLNGLPLPLDIPFTANDLQYPNNWLRLASPEERAAIGITEVEDVVRPDDRYYWVDGNNVGTPKDLTMLKTVAIKQVRETVWLMLQKTDYMDSRKANDPSYTPPAAWIDWRASVRSKAGQIEIAINAATDIPTLIAAVAVNWPQDPDYQVQP